jgi:hypothetical protein
MHQRKFLQREITGCWQQHMLGCSRELFTCDSRKQCEVLDSIKTQIETI